MKIGLALSGGGYRAAAFHLGTLKALNHLGILKNINTLSTISGGSIIGAAYCLSALSFNDFFNTFYRKINTCNIIRQLIFSITFLKLILFLSGFLFLALYALFSPYPWAVLLVLALGFFLFLRFQFSIFPASRQVEKSYNHYFFNTATLQQLPDNPRLVIGSTNLDTGRPFTFSKGWMQDSTYQYLRLNNQPAPVKFLPCHFPIARAVMASSCVPFAFTPVRIQWDFFNNPILDYDRVKPQLIDGGVYDNQGIHKIMQQGQYACDLIIASDAGNKLSPGTVFHNMLTVLIRTVDIFMARIKNLQLIQDIYDNTALANKQIAYLSLGWDLQNCIPGFIQNLEEKNVPDSVIAAHQIPSAWAQHPSKYQQELTQLLINNTDYNNIPQPTPTELECARSVGTNLTPLNTSQLDALIKQAYALTLLQVRLYCPAALPANQ